MGNKEFDLFPIFKQFLFEKGFFRNLPVMEGAVETLKKLCAKFDVCIVSAVMEFPQSLPEKKEWLSEHFPFIGSKNIALRRQKHPQDRLHD